VLVAQCPYCCYEAQSRPLKTRQKEPSISQFRRKTKETYIKIRGQLGLSLSWGGKEGHY
jgi:hypothetical protein